MTKVYVCSPLPVEYGIDTYDPTHRRYFYDGCYYEFRESTKPILIKKSRYGDYTITLTRDHPYFNLDILRYKLSIPELGEYGSKMYDLTDAAITQLINRKKTN
jgi:hypothetical protein